MRWLLLILLIFSCSLLGYVQEDINQTDAQGRKQGHWVYYGKDRPEMGYPEDGKVEEGDYLNDRKVGEWIKYHPDGETPKIRGNYTSTFPYTYRIDYDSTGAFVNKTLFYHDSTLTRQHHWFDNTSFLRTVRGQSVTDSFIYYSSIDFYDSLIIVHFDSRVLETYYFQKHNKWHSSLKREVVSIQLGAQPLRQNETMIDQLITYETGPINQTIDGKHEGYWITLGKDKPEYGYPENGKVQHGGYVNGRKEGTWVKYHTDGITPKLIGHYQNNRPNGHYWKITPEGTIMEKGKFFHGKYKDTLYRYYPDGKLKYLGILDSLGQSLVDSFYFYNGECRDSVMVNKYNQSAQKRWVVLYSKKQCNVVDTVLDRNTSRHHNEWHYRVPKKREK
ncbi:MAG: hypothetical protein NXI10_17850, partial [bacterium]|nr:hypothetical protein [bacterium]